MKLQITAFAAMAAIGLAVAPAKAETFKWAFQGDVQTMDPHGLFETMTLGFQRNIYEGLVIRNEKMEMVGALAESYKKFYTNAREYVFQREDGIFINPTYPLWS